MLSQVLELKETMSMKLDKHLNGPKIGRSSMDLSSLSFFAIVIMATPCPIQEFHTEKEKKFKNIEKIKIQSSFLDQLPKNLT